MTQALSPGTIRIQNSQVCEPSLWRGGEDWEGEEELPRVEVQVEAGWSHSLWVKITYLILALMQQPPVNLNVSVLFLFYSSDLSL